MWSVQTVTVTGAEPVTVAEAKQQCRVTSAAQDALLGRLVKVAREAFERRTGLLLRAQTVVLNIDAFSRELQLPHAPIRSVTGVFYTDAAGAEQALAEERYIFRRPLGVPTLKATSLGGGFPVVGADGVVEIEVEAGYEDGQVPETYRHAILMIVADLFKNPESTVEGLTSESIAMPVGVKSIIADARLRWL
jgi:uncharacterized phiE125 gp8 family phage protein